MASSVETIKAAGFRLTAEDGTLFVEPASRLTDEQRTWIRQHKAELLKALNASNDPPPRPTGNHQGWSWGQWNGWIVGASEAERAAALEAMPDTWRYHIQKHLDDVNMLRKRSEGRA